MSKFRAALYRASHTVAQAALALIPTTAVTLDGVNWGVVAQGALLAGVISLLKSAAVGMPEVER